MKSNKILATLDKITENIENYVMSFGLMAISAIVFANVIARYFFATSFAWSEELSRYIVVWITFLGISSCARHDAHVKVDLLSNILKGKARKYHDIIINALMVVLCIYMTYISFTFMSLQFVGGNTSVSIAIPIWTIYLSTFLGFLLTTFAYCKRVYMGIKTLNEAEKVESPTTNNN